MKVVLELFERHFGQTPTELTALPRSGSDRQYYRLTTSDHTVVAAYNPNILENAAFVKFTRHFKEKGIAVPEIYAVSADQQVYLLQDLGNQTLYNLLKTNGLDEKTTHLYQQTLEQLARLQILGHEGFNYRKWCYENPVFDKKAMLWDLNYFKYYFLKVSGLPFDESKLEADFQRLAQFLTHAKHDFFLFRDFQARNVMIINETPYFIDYQGGRKGALAYDVASILSQAQADLPFEVRETLLQHYLDAAQTLTSIEPLEFRTFYYPFVLIRCLQTLGAYGFRGLYEGKAHFLSSIPFAIKNLVWVLENLSNFLKINYLKEILKQLIELKDWNQYLPKGKKDRLTVAVHSFSFLRTHPTDSSGNGGGHVFDCRAIHNPGRYEAYRTLTGRDPEVAAFLEQEPAAHDFFENARRIAENSVRTYLERGFTNLSVSFGCTGGQHRSVYFAERMAAYLKANYDIDVVLHHLEQKIVVNMMD